MFINPRIREDFSTSATGSKPSWLGSAPGCDGSNRIRAKQTQNQTQLCIPGSPERVVWPPCPPCKEHPRVHPGVFPACPVSLKDIPATVPASPALSQAAKPHPAPGECSSRQPPPSAQKGFLPSPELPLQFHIPSSPSPSLHLPPPSSCQVRPQTQPPPGLVPPNFPSLTHSGAEGEEESGMALPRCVAQPLKKQKPHLQRNLRRAALGSPKPRCPQP